MPGNEFCSLHCQKLPYGRVDNPMDPCVQARIDKSMKRKQRKSAKRWYCRYFMFKQAQATWNLENVDGMNDEQYSQALESVHDFLVRNASQRHAWKLKHDQGPEDVTERDTPKALYAGAPIRYKNYSYRLLCYYVTKQQPGATPRHLRESSNAPALRTRLNNIE